MARISKRTRITIAFLGVLGVILLFAYAAAAGLLRPLYFAALTEIRLARRGDSLVRIRFSARDEMNQIYIPAGEFSMGPYAGTVKRGATQHRVYLHAYWIDQFTVTNAMYTLCVKSRRCRHTASYDSFLDEPAYADYPAHYVNWYDASAFSIWEGGRLPTEAEWEKAARGLNALRYPWGNTEPDDTLLNFNGRYGAPKSAYDYWPGMSPYGLLNMAGNVQQWVADWYAADYYSYSPYENPTGPKTGNLKVLRGGGYWDTSKEVQTFFRFRHDPASAGAHRGIRCVQDAAQ